MNTYEQSAEIAALATAMSAAQGEIENATKDSKNDHFRNRYASLAAVLEEIRPVFSKHGLVLTQDAVYEGEMVGVMTTVAHKSGQWKRSVLLCKPVKAGPQEIGSVLTYFRRYAAAAVAGISQEDDDAERGSGRGHQKAAEPREKTMDEWKAEVRNEGKANGCTTADDFTARFQDVLQKDRPENPEDCQKMIAHFRARREGKA